MRSATGDDRRPGRAVIVEKRKWDGSISARWPIQLLAADHDRWLWRAPAGTARERPHSGRSERCEHEEVTLGCGAGWLLTVVIEEDGRVVGCRADAVTAPRLAGPDLVTFVDLDLDLIIDPMTGEATLVDEADLARRTQEMGYPDSLVRGAWEGIADVRDRLARRRWPFAPDGGPPTGHLVMRPRHGA